MEIEEWKGILYKCKTTATETAFHPFRDDTKILVSPDRKKFTITKTFLCKCCGDKKHKRLIVYFYEPHEKNLSIFQAEMLYMIFVEGKKPADYANYHKCVAGQEFINNIEKIINE